MRIKTVFDNSMVAHVWAQQKQTEGRGSSFFFDGPTIFSYGRHFPIAKFSEHNGNKCILFTLRDYSVTTQRHKSLTRRAIPAGIPVFHVSDVTISDSSMHSHRTNLQDYQKRVNERYASALRARKNAEWLQTNCIALANEANQYAEFFGVDYLILVPRFTPEAIAAAKLEAKKQAEKDREEKARKVAAAKADFLEQVKEWRAFERDSLWTSVYFGDGNALLRRKDETLQTSQGAEVPMVHAIRAFRFVKLVRERGAPWARNGHAVRVGHFQIDTIDAAGNIKAGCHSIQWSEIESFAKAQGFFDDTASADAVEPSNVAA